MKTNGFTLVELIVVILLIGILSIFAAPKFVNDDSFKARGLADEIVTAIRHAQRLSMSRGENHRVIITTTSYTVEKFVSTVSSSVRHPDGGATFNKSFPPNIVISAATIEFDQIGRPIPNNLTKIELVSFTVQVEEETGYAHIL